MVIETSTLLQELLSYWKQFGLISIKEGILRRRWSEVSDQKESRDLIIAPNPCMYYIVITRKLHMLEYKIVLWIVKDIPTGQNE